MNCILQYGPVFKILLCGHHLTFVASEEAIQSYLVADGLSTRTQNHSIFGLVASGSSHTQKLCAIASREFFPLLEKRLAKRTLGDVTPGFAEAFFNRLKRFANYQGSLRRSLTEPLYVASNAILLGSRFSPDTYDDYLVFDLSLPDQVSMLPFWSSPSRRAKERLLEHLAKYIEDADTDHDDSLGAILSKALKKHNLTSKEGAPMIFAIEMAAHANMFNVVFWLVTWLLADPSALAAVRDEIDKTVREEFGSIHGFLVNASPERLQSSSFELLHSTVLETVRLSSLVLGVRDAVRDVDLKDGERVIPIRKGEYVVAMPWAAHRDEGLYPDGHKFIADRFVHNKVREDLVQNPGKPFFSFGGGKHPCPGRLLAIYELKVMAIIYFSLFDVTPVPQGYGSSQWTPPQPSPESTGTFHTTEDVIVKLRPRFDF